jgi:hypothetical protein
VDFEREEDRRRRELRKAEEKAAKAAARHAESKKQARAAHARLLASTARHETWHAYRLSAQDRAAGFTGEMSEARHYLRSLPARDYVRELAPFAQEAPETAIVEIELKAVLANLAGWIAKGRERLYEAARAAYKAECANFSEWAANNPGADQWKDKPATRAQWMLIRRTAVALDLDDVPTKLSRGDAHDWLDRNGANIRYKGAGHTPGLDAEPSRTETNGGDETSAPGGADGSTS